MHRTHTHTHTHTHTRAQHTLTHKFIFYYSETGSVNSGAEKRDLELCQLPQQPATSGSAVNLPLSTITEEVEELPLSTPLEKSSTGEFINWQRKSDAENEGEGEGEGEGEREGEVFERESAPSTPRVSESGEARVRKRLETCNRSLCHSNSPYLSC